MQGERNLRRDVRAMSEGTVEKERRRGVREKS